MSRATGPRSLPVARHLLAAPFTTMFLMLSRAVCAARCACCPSWQRMQQTRSASGISGLAVMRVDSLQNGRPAI